MKRVCAHDEKRGRWDEATFSLGCAVGNCQHFGVVQCVILNLALEEQEVARGGVGEWDGEMHINWESKK